MRKLCEKSLWNAAVYYLRRYAATEEQLRRVLKRKARRVSPEEPPELKTWLDAVLLRLKDLGYVNDASVAHAKVSAWRRAGKSTRAIKFQLQLKGVSQDIIQQVSQASPESDEVAIWTLARKKKLGPFRRVETRAEFRHKDLAALARAGFSYALAESVVDAPQPQPAP